MRMETPSLVISFLAGLLSFFSPCVLAIAPGYLAVLSGTVPTEAGAEKGDSQRTILASVLFILGFTLVFVLLGTAFSTLGRLVAGWRGLFLKVGGLFLVFLGLNQWGVFRLFALQQEFRFHLKQPLTGVFGWLMTGVTFAFGWTPCVGPILGMILTLAGSYGQVETGALLLLIYSLGLALPFFLMALAFNRFYGWYKRLFPYTKFLNWLSGLLLVGVGILLFTDRFSLLTLYLNKIMGGRSLEEILLRPVK
jgi:cytochrome c-type biogenesis protein